MDEAKAVKSPMVAHSHFAPTKGEHFPDPHIYRRTIGAFQYACLTRSGLSYAVNELSQFMSALTNIHWQACKSVL